MNELTIMREALESYIGTMALAIMHASPADKPRYEVRYRKANNLLATLDYARDDPTSSEACSIHLAETGSVFVGD